MTQKGLLGWLDPSGTLSGPLGDWASAAGARRVLSEGPFSLWQWPDSTARIFDHGARCGALLGGPFGVDGDAALDQVFSALEAKAFHRLNGHLLLMAWDRQGARLSLFRDDSSALPLYYGTTPGGGLAWSDDLDLLARCPAFGRRIAPASLHEYLRFMDVSTPNTIVAGVYSTEPGIELVVEPGGEPRAVTPPGPARVSVPADLESATDLLEAALTDAVARRLPGEGPVLAFLSGGIDSSLIAAIAARLAPGRVTAYTVGFEEARYDETPVAAAIAEHLRLPHQVLRLPVASYRPAFDAWTRAIAYPFADPAAVPTLLAFEAARALAPVALDGTGADTLLGIMPARHHRLAARLGTWVPRALRPRIAQGLRAAGPLSGLAPLVDFDDPEEILVRWRAWPRREVERLCGGPVSLAHTRYYRIYRGFRPRQHLERYSALMGNLPDDRIHEASRITGLEVRFPFFDPEVVALVNALPMDLRYRPGEHKRILRHLLARHVPRPVWDVPKHGFDFPFRDLMRLDDHALIRDYLAPERVAGSGLVDPHLVAETLARFLDGDDSEAFRVWTLVVLFAWLRNHWGEWP